MVGTLAAAMGTGAAWLVTMYRFPGRGWLAHALLFPLAIPAYVGAYALVDFLDYSGALQTTLRALFGWRNARDYWFPTIRSEWAAILVLSSVLYPYVYLLTRQALREQSGGIYEVARALGLIANILDPDVIVLGGGLSNMQHLYADLPGLMAPHVLGDVARTPIVQAKHGDSSGVFGAARLWDAP